MTGHVSEDRYPVTEDGTFDPVIPRPERIVRRLVVQQNAAGSWSSCMKFMLSMCKPVREAELHPQESNLVCSYAT